MHIDTGTIIFNLISNLQAFKVHSLLLLHIQYKYIIYYDVII